MTSGMQQRPRSLTSSCLRLSQRPGGRGGNQYVWGRGGKAGCCSSLRLQSAFTSQPVPGLLQPRRQRRARRDGRGNPAQKRRGSCSSCPAICPGVSALITGTGIQVNAVTAAPPAQGPKSFHSHTTYSSFFQHVSQGCTPINALCLCIFYRLFSGIIVCVPFKQT